MWRRQKNSPGLSFLKFLPLAYYHGYFMAVTFDFTCFFIIVFLGVAQLFTACCVFMPCIKRLCMLYNQVLSRLVLNSTYVFEYLQELQRVAELQLSLQNTVSVCVNGRRYVHTIHACRMLVCKCVCTYVRTT